MDYKGLAERLRTESLYKDKATLEIMDMCMDAATAITELSGKVEQLERQFMEVFGDIEKIRMEHGVDNPEADNAFAELCEKYCDNNGVMCYKSGKGYQCENFKLKGVQNEKSEGA